MKTDPVDLIPIIEEDVIGIQKYLRYMKASEEDIKLFRSNGIITFDEMTEAIRRLKDED